MKNEHTGKGGNKISAKNKMYAKAIICRRN